MSNQVIASAPAPIPPQTDRTQPIQAPGAPSATASQISGVAVPGGTGTGQTTHNVRSAQVVDNATSSNQTVPPFAPDFRWTCRLALPAGAVASTVIFLQPVVPVRSAANEAPVGAQNSSNLLTWAILSASSSWWGGETTGGMSCRSSTDPLARA